jgi:hypothetical protein
MLITPRPKLVPLQKRDVDAIVRVGERVCMCCIDTYTHVSCRHMHSSTLLY